MRILADENIMLVREHFSPFGEVQTVAGRSITSALASECDALLVRSVTKVDRQLLAGSRCGFVASATSGIDHVDVDGLAAAGIKVAWAPGGNAISVVDYVFSVLAVLSLAGKKDWQQSSFGIIGCGQIGSVLADRLLALGLSVKIHDPFLSAEHRLAPHFCSLNDALQQRVITLHVPLTRDGAWPTHHMLTEAALALISPDALLINAARGGVVDNQLLLRWLQTRPQQQLVLDAWENEPAISLDLLRQVNLGTPHIAGYSQEGKLRGTQMILQAFQQHFGLSTAAVAAESAQRTVLKPLSTDNAALQLNQLLVAAYDVRGDHGAMLQLLSSSSAVADFDRLRKQYPIRHEFSGFAVSVRQLLPSVKKTAAVMGFAVTDQF
ncbi:MAG: 4-phosphoerythronate dehydrogenase [Pseudomonadota bacterium]